METRDGPLPVRVSLQTEGWNALFVAETPDNREWRDGSLAGLEATMKAALGAARPVESDLRSCIRDFLDMTQPPGNDPWKARQAEPALEALLRAEDKADSLEGLSRCLRTAFDGRLRHASILATDRNGRPAGILVFRDRSALVLFEDAGGDGRQMRPVPGIFDAGPALTGSGSDPWKARLLVGRSGQENRENDAAQADTLRMVVTGTDGTTEIGFPSRLDDLPEGLQIQFRSVLAKGEAAREMASRLPPIRPPRPKTGDRKIDSCGLWRDGQGEAFFWPAILGHRCFASDCLAERARLAGELLELCLWADPGLEARGQVQIRSRPGSCAPEASIRVLLGLNKVDRAGAQFRLPQILCDQIPEISEIVGFTLAYDRTGAHRCPDLLLEVEACRPDPQRALLLTRKHGTLFSDCPGWRDPSTLLRGPAPADAGALPVRRFLQGEIVTRPGWPVLIEHQVLRGCLDEKDALFDRPMCLMMAGGLRAAGLAASIGALRGQEQDPYPAGRRYLPAPHLASDDFRASLVLSEAHDPLALHPLGYATLRFVFETLPLLDAETDGFDESHHLSLSFDMIFIDRKHRGQRLGLALISGAIEMVLSEIEMIEEGARAAGTRHAIDIGIAVDPGHPASRNLMEKARTALLDIGMSQERRESLVRIESVSDMPWEPPFEPDHAPKLARMQDAAVPPCPSGRPAGNRTLLYPDLISSPLVLRTSLPKSGHPAHLSVFRDLMWEKLATLGIAPDHLLLRELPLAGAGRDLDGALRWAPRGSLSIDAMLELQAAMSAGGGDRVAQAFPPSLRDQQTALRLIEQAATADAVLGAWVLAALVSVERGGRKPSCVRRELDRMRDAGRAASEDFKVPADTRGIADFSSREAIHLATELTGAGARLFRDAWPGYAGRALPEDGLLLAVAPSGGGRGAIPCAGAASVPVLDYVAGSIARSALGFMPVRLTSGACAPLPWIDREIERRKGSVMTSPAAQQPEKPESRTGRPEGRPAAGGAVTLADLASQDLLRLVATMSLTSLASLLDISETRLEAAVDAVEAEWFAHDKGELSPLPTRRKSGGQGRLLDRYPSSDFLRHRARDGSKRLARAFGVPDDRIAERTARARRDVHGKLPASRTVTEFLARMRI